MRAFAAALVLLALPVVAEAKTTVLKVATLAPKGSAWAKVLEKGADDIKQRTNGRVEVKYYFGGVQGDERDVVRFMTRGQLDGAFLTGVGLGLIVTDVRVLDLPFLFKDDWEVDQVRAKLAPDFESKFVGAGYQLIAWGDIGWVHLYSNVDVQSKADLLGTKMWAWTDDPIIPELLKRLGVNGVPLGVPDVLPALKTGLLDACYGSPLGAVAAQWYTKVKFATSTPIAYSAGAYLIRYDVFKALDAADQVVVLDAGEAMGIELTRTVRKDNDRAKMAMKKAGVKFTATPTVLMALLESQSHLVWNSLVGKLYDKKLLETVVKHRDLARGSKSTYAYTATSTVTSTTTTTSTSTTMTTSTKQPTTTMVAAREDPELLEAVDAAPEDIRALRLALEDCDVETMSWWIRFPLQFGDTRYRNAAALRKDCLVKRGPRLGDPAELEDALTTWRLRGGALHLIVGRSTWTFVWRDKTWCLSAIE